MDIWSGAKIAGAIGGLIWAGLAIINAIKKPSLHAVLEVAQAEARKGARLFYQINVHLTAMDGGGRLETVHLTHERVMQIGVDIKYALNEYVDHDLLLLSDEAFIERIKQLGGPEADPPPIRLDQLVLKKGKTVSLTFAGSVPFVLSNAQLKLIPIEGWKLDIVSSLGSSHFKVFEPRRIRRGN